jgi:hypothetical protein
MFVLQGDIIEDRSPKENLQNFENKYKWDLITGVIEFQSKLTRYKNNLEANQTNQFVWKL